MIGHGLELQSRERLASLDWKDVSQDLDEHGYALVEGILSVAKCEALASMHVQEDLFRNTVIMERHGYGRGEYRYFKYPLPNVIGALRELFYRELVATANRWNEALGLGARFPKTHAEFVARCHEAGQCRPTPLLLRYRVGDFNCLHQDLYGEHFFPIQATILLSTPGVDFTGGEFVLVEQRPRVQSRVHVIPLKQGDGVIFAVRDRPVEGKRARYRTLVRHGVSRVLSGNRQTAGIILHDAR